jgi:prepilin signal peptidase PulO-like enzyme (type II secretory pathway)
MQDTQCQAYQSVVQKRLQKVSCICLVSYPLRFQLLRYVPQTGYYALTFILLNVVAIDFSTAWVYQIIVQKSCRIPWITDKASTIKRQHTQTEEQT